MEPCASCLNTVVFLFNFACLIISSAVVALGGYIYSTLTTRYNGLFIDYGQDAAIILMFIGSVLMIVSFFGCCGACIQSAVMMYCYGAFLLVILLGLFGLAVTAFAYRGYIHDNLEYGLKGSIIDYGYPDANSSTELWNIIQKDGACCGVDGYKDWLRTNFGSRNGDVPDECCFDTLEGCGKGMALKREHEARNVINTRGCLPHIELNVMELCNLGAGISMGISAFLSMAVYVAWYVAGKIVGDEPLIV